MGLGFRVLGLGFRVLGLGFRVLGLGFRVLGVLLSLDSGSGLRKSADSSQHMQQKRKTNQHNPWEILGGKSAPMGAYLTLPNPTFL